jgi:hypothetical protein
MSIAAATTSRLAAFTVDNHLWTVTATGKNSFSVSMESDAVTPTPLAETTTTISTTVVKADDAPATANSETQGFLRGEARRLDGGRVLCDCGAAKTEAERVECGCDSDE